MVAASAAAGNVESFLGTTMNAYYNAAITFTGQNMGGAKEYDRIDTIAQVSAVFIFATWIILGGLILFFLAVRSWPFTLPIPKLWTMA